MELAFEYLMSKDSLQWISIKTDQVSVLCSLRSVCNCVILNNVSLIKKQTLMGVLNKVNKTSSIRKDGLLNAGFTTSFFNKFSLLWGKTN